MGAALRAQGQYRANLLLMACGGLAYQGVGFIFVWVVIDRFGAIGGWSLAEVAFLYGLRLTAHGVFVWFLNQMMVVDQVVREGEFDRYLVRPVNPLVQLMTRGVQLTVVGDLIGGIGLLVAAAAMIDIDWSAGAVAFLVLAILGGGLVEGACQLIAGSLSFRILSTNSLRFSLDDMFNTFGGYPLKIFPVVARFGLTFVLPLAFVAYLPSTVLLDRTDELSVSPWFAYCAPLAGAVLMFLAYRFWRFQSRYYSSSGH